MESELPRERVGKYSSARDEVLDAMATGGWGNDSSGNVEAPTGWFARISISEPELAEIVDAFDGELEQAELKDTSELLGHWLLVEDEQGFVHVSGYDSEEAVTYDFNRLAEIYDSWLEGDE